MFKNKIAVGIGILARHPARRLLITDYSLVASSRKFEKSVALLSFVRRMFFEGERVQKSHLLHVFEHTRLIIFIRVCLGCFRRRKSSCIILLVSIVLEPSRIRKLHSSLEGLRALQGSTKKSLPWEL